MKQIIILLGTAAFLAGCGSKSSADFTRSAPAGVQTASRSEPVHYNGKTYQLDYAYRPDKTAFDVKVAGLSAKGKKDAINIASSSLGYFACPEGQRGRIIGEPIFRADNWALMANCG